MRPDWLPLTWTLLPDGWATDDAALLERLRRGPFSLWDAGVFWLERDFRAIKVWCLWLGGFAGLAYGALHANTSAIAAGAALIVVWLVGFSTMVRTWTRATLASGRVVRVVPHLLPGAMAGELVDGRKVTLDSKLASFLTEQKWPVDCVYIADSDPNAYQLLLAVRLAQD